MLQTGADNMPDVNEIIKGLLNTRDTQQGKTVEGTFELDQNPSLNRIANNGKALTQGISKLTQTLEKILNGWGVS